MTNCRNDIPFGEIRSNDITTKFNLPKIMTKKSVFCIAGSLTHEWNQSTR